MANLSSAEGNLSIELNEGQPDEKYKALAEALDMIQRGWYYRFYLHDIESANDTIPFDGDGRWAFSCNIENFGFNMQSTLDEHSENIDFENAEYIKNIDELKDILINTDYKLEFNYLDNEPGMCTLYAAIEELTHKAGDSLDKIVYNVVEQKDYDYSYAGLLEATDDPEFALEHTFSPFYDESIYNEDLIELIQETIDDLKPNQDDVAEFLEVFQNSDCIEIKDSDKLSIDKDFNVVVEELEK